MKETTHYLFSIGLSFCVLSMLHSLDMGSLIMAVWLCFSVNSIIDLLGHVSRKGVPTRSWFTHSVFTAPIWGGLIGVFTLEAISKTLGLTPAVAVIGLWTVTGAIIAYGHLLLDSMTGAGVYFTRRRIALAHFSYDNGLLNLGFILVGLCLAALSLRV